MKLKSLAGILCVLVAALVVSAAYAEPAPQVAAASAATAPATDATPLPSFETLFGSGNEPLYAAASNGRGAQAKGGGLTFSRGHSSETCEWYWISCSNGTSDSCCADLWSCWDYCESFCGGPCVYVPNET